MTVAFKHILECIPGYSQIDAGYQKSCIDGILAHPNIELCQAVFEHMDHGDLFKDIDVSDQKFLKENALKVLEVVRVWQGRGRSTSCNAWGIYLAGLIIILCFTLGTLHSTMFGLLSHFYYLTVFFMVCSHTVSQYSTPTALKRLHRDFALTMEFPALGYTAAAIFPSLYEKPWYSFIIIGLTTLHLVWHRFLPVIGQDRLCLAHKRRKNRAIEQGPVSDQPYVTADQLRPICIWLEALDILEGTSDEITEYFKYSGSSRHNTQVTLFSEGWNNVIVRLYDLLPEHKRRDRLSRLSRQGDNESATSGMVKLVLTGLYFPVGTARVPPLYKAGEYGAFAQSCIAVIDVGVTLCYRTRSENYTIPAFSDLYSAVMIFAIAGFAPIWTLWNEPGLFSDNIWWLCGGYVFMFLMTFVFGPALIYSLKVNLIKGFASEQSAIEWLESQAEPVEYALEFPIEYPLEFRMGLPGQQLRWFSNEYPMGLPTDFTGCFSSHHPMVLPNDLTSNSLEFPPRLLPGDFTSCFPKENLMGVVQRLDDITAICNNNLDD